jgi:hypothetical protein
MSGYIDGLRTIEHQPNEQYTEDGEDISILESEIIGLDHTSSSSLFI